MGNGTEAFDGRVQSDQRAGHVVADGIGIKAAVDLATLIEQGAQPAWVGPGAGGGQATVLPMKSKATDRIDGRLTKNEHWASFGVDNQPCSWCRSKRTDDRELF